MVAASILGSLLTISPARMLVSESVTPPLTTPTVTCSAGVHQSPEWVNFYSAHTTSDGVSVPVGACIEAYVGTIKIGYYVVDSTGYYGFLAAYRDDPTTPEKDGALPGDAITFTINGYPATPTGIYSGITNPTWTVNGDTLQVDLGASTATATLRSLFLPVIFFGSSP